VNAAVIAETVRRHLTSVAFVSFLVLLAFLGFGVSRFHVPGAVWPSLVSLLAIVVGAGLIGPEFSTGTLQLIVSRPISRSAYLLSRFAGVMTVVAIAAIVPFVCEGVARLVFAARPLSVAPLVNVVAAGALACALLVLFGSVSRGYFNVAIYFLIQIGLSASQAILGLIRVRGGAIGREAEEAVAWVEQILFPARPPHVDGAWLLRVAIVGALALTLACLAFRRREVPYGAD
jgi:hypothetical protein